jgi:uncharacterized protein (TIGR02600 family)
VTDFLSTKRAAALVISLAFLVLLSAVVLALLSTSRTDRQNANAFATGQETMRLADAAVSLVQGQIRDATIQPRVGWASQPGMIRTFNTSNQVTAYKLYSSDAMVVPNYGKPEMDQEFNEIKDWNQGALGKSFNARFVDLNAPAVVRRPNLATPNPYDTTLIPIFPIADPAAIGSVEGFNATTTVNGTVLGNGTDRRLPMPVKWIYVLRDGQMTAPSSGNATQVTFSGSVVPTQDNPIVGRIAFWADDDNCKLNINTASEGIFWDVPRATTYSEVRMAISMPVRGEFQRLVNHPAFTSLSPVFKSISGNYTRPTVDILNTTSGFSSIVSDPDSYYSKFVSYYDITPRINGFLGSADKSSKGGAQRTSAVGRGNQSSERVPNALWPWSDQPDDSSGMAFKPKGAPLPPDTDRLYATVDEVLFTSNRTMNRDFTANTIAARSFFLTASGRSPETTVFGTPKISLWPSQKSPSDRNIRDRLLNFCATVGNFTYAFEREISNGGIYVASSFPADSQTHDVSLAANQKLLGYLRKLVEAQPPGYASPLQSKWGQSGIDRILAQTFDCVRANTNSFYVSLGNGTDRVTYRYSTTSRNPRSFIPPDSFGNTFDNANGPTNGVIPVKIGNANGMGRNVIFDQVAIVFMAREVENTYTYNYTSSNITYTDTVQEISNGETYSLSKALQGNVTYSGLPQPQTQTTKKIAAFLLFSPYLASPSFLPGVVPGLQIEVENFGAMQVEGTNFVPGNPVLTMRAGSQCSNGNGDEQNRHSQLMTSFGMFQVFANRPDPGHMSGNQTGGDKFKFKNAISNGSDKDYYYPFVSQDISVTGNGTISFSGGDIIITIKNYKGNQIIQKFSISFPPATIPIPQHIDDQVRYMKGEVSNINLDSASGYAVWNQGSLRQGDFLSPRKRLIGNSNSGNTQLIAVRPGDVVLGVIVNPNGPTRGDLRLLALTQDIPSNWFTTFPGYGTANTRYNPSSPNARAAITGRFAFGFRGLAPDQPHGEEVGWSPRNNDTQVNQFRPVDVASNNSTLISGLAMTGNARPVAAPGLGGAIMTGNATGDWSSGIGGTPDGAFFTFTDPGDSNLLFGGYFGTKKPLFVPTGNTWEPNRMVPSAGILGQILTTDQSGNLQPWQTLLFTRTPAAGSAHPGFATSSLPPDYLFLDFFWMPIIEPYAISEPASTAGKVNLNIQMLPFTHIQRSTALHGALQGLRLSAIPNSAATTYKPSAYTSVNSTVIIRHPLNIDATIARMFDEVFDVGDFYKIPSEVAKIQLIAQGETASSMGSWWNARRLTSDTLREHPYTALLSRVTTKSNTFTVHYRVQALRQVPRPGRNWTEWAEDQDQVVGEYRGSTTIERFLDPNEQNVPDYTQVNLSGNYDPIDKFYRWRVVSQKQFAP